MTKKTGSKFYTVLQTFDCPWEGNKTYPAGAIIDISSWNVLDVQNALGGFLISEQVGAEPTQETEEALTYDENIRP